MRVSYDSECCEKELDGPRRAHVRKRVCSAQRVCGHLGLHAILIVEAGREGIGDWSRWGVSVVGLRCRIGSRPPQVHWRWCER